MKRIIFISAVILFAAMTATASWAANKNAGTSAYSFLRVGVGARAQAMGGAMVGLANDEYAGYYNPAGLGLLSPVVEYENEYGEMVETESDITKYFAASYNNYIAEIQSGYLAFIMRQGYGRMVGFSLDYFDYGTFDRVDIDNQQTGTFSASDMAFGASFGQRVSGDFHWGVTGKFIYQKLESYSSDGLALDGGVLYRMRDEHTRLGFAVRNIGVQLKGLTSEHKDKLPGSAHAGVSHILKGAPILVTAQIDYPFDYDMIFRVGAEISGLDPFFLRLGWNSLGKDQKSGSSNDKSGGFAGGFGYIWGDYSLDYSYSSFADIGDSHRVSLAGGF